jgi:signal recognition particle receptor subunit beta
LRSTWSSYFLNTDGVILVVDSTDRERAAIVRSELEKLLLNEELKQACILVFANKQDLREAMTAAEISEHLQLHAIRTHEVWASAPAQADSELFAKCSSEAELERA